MSWRAYQKNHLKSFKRGFKYSPMPYVFMSAIIVLIALLYIIVKHSGHVRPPDVSTAVMPMTTPALSAAKPTETEIRSAYRVNLPANDVTKWIEHVMGEYRVRYGAVVAIDVKTCKPVAVISIGKDFSAFNAYPAASLIKLVTAAAAIEINRISPYALFYYDYRNASQSIRALTNGYQDGRKQITFSMALAKSNNPVFGKIALYKIGNNNLRSYFDRFYFNKPVGPPFIKQSKAVVEEDAVNIAQTGAGLNPDTTLSPFHAALIVQAIGNNGKMCVPYAGFDGSKQNAVQVMQPQTAKELIDMMRLTITKGTSRRAFFNRRGRYILANITVAGKTGSIRGDSPGGDYEWFVGVAPADDPQLAVAAVVVNGNKWTIKGSYLGAQAFFAYFFPDAVKKLLHER